MGANENSGGAVAHLLLDGGSTSLQLALLLLCRSAALLCTALESFAPRPLPRKSSLGGFDASPQLFRALAGGLLSSS